MYYLLALLLFMLSYFVFTKVLQSIVKGCFMAIFILVLVTVVSLFIKSMREPVTVFNMYRIDKLEVRKM